MWTAVGETVADGGAASANALREGCVMSEHLM